MIYTRLIGAALLLALVAWDIAMVDEWRREAAKLPAAKQEAAQAVSDLALYRLSADRRVADANETSKGFRDELEKLRTPAAAGPAVVSVCSGPAVAPSVRRAEVLPGRPDATAASAGRDLGGNRGSDPIPMRQVDLSDEYGRLRAAAVRADAVSAQLRALESLIAR